MNWEDRSAEIDAIWARERAKDTRDKSHPCYRTQGTSLRFLVVHRGPSRADRRRKARVLDRAARKADRAVRRVEIRQEFENGLGSTDAV